MVYGLEVLLIKKKDSDKLEITQRKIIRQIPGLQARQQIQQSMCLLEQPAQLVIERNMLYVPMSIIRNQS